MYTTETIHQLLNTQVAYYQKLPAPEQARFARRVSFFLDHKSIDGRQGLEVTPAMQILLAATAVQLTFGLETWDYSFFRQIFIYPADYQNPATGNYHKGETNMGGFMCFSWKHFVEGIAIPNDKINLGLHEFAHALRFNGVRGDEVDYFFDHYFDRWLSCAVTEYQRLKHSNHSIFRKYGSVNINEFFSVAVETFFEDPVGFKAYFPELFDQTAILLNQYPGADGTPVLNVRNRLMQERRIRMPRDYSGLLSYTFGSSGTFIFGLLFLVVALFSFAVGGFAYPPPYICLAVASLSWLLLELRFVRLRFEADSLYISKGWLVLRNYKWTQIPYTQLIGLWVDEGRNEGQHALRLRYTDLEGNFYEESLEVKIAAQVFNQLSAELRKYYIPVLVRG